MTIGIIGGSGLYDIEGIEGMEERRIDTPFGDPSDAYRCGTLAGRAVCFLPRHGQGHRLLPSEINHPANIFGFKLLGVERVLSISAVGSLREDLHPRDIVLPDQYFDRTKASDRHTFFGKGLAAHVSFGDPVCPELRAVVDSVARGVIAADAESGVSVHNGGTYVNMEGPAFSTKAESNFHRKMGFDVVGMTSLAEAKLCREAELCYQAMSMVTDYDCWHESDGPVTVEMVIGHLMANSALAKRIVVEAVTAVPEGRECACGESLKYALLTPAEVVPEETRRALAPIVGKYLPVA